MSCSEFNFQTGTCTEVEKDFNFAKVMTVRDLDNVIVDLTGLTFQLVVKDILAGSVLFTLDHVGDNLTTGLYIPNPSSGVINIQIIKHVTIFRKGLLKWLIISQFQTMAII